ncbi:RHS repeat-associated core domain-containing protein [Dyella sp. 2HG41-7]|uniref:RHS repeat-associated core domain-containing protein n=1 Tax=Dyella sp. 2HG41-7 TaxID=2883239 RepID=UPI001F35F0E9|nr:RHS repeat-associated core domain-containing protein [Dyella sp. 2HG41-7]
MDQGHFAMHVCAVMNERAAPQQNELLQPEKNNAYVGKAWISLVVGLTMIVSASPVFAQTANTKTTYTYDALDRLTQVTDPSGLATTYQYDGLSDPTTLTSPDTGVTARTFDAAGNVLTGTDANQNTVTYTYDAQNRRLSASYTDSTQNITYTYDEPNTATGCSTSYPIGHLTHIVENAVTTAYCYDTQGRVTRKSQSITSPIGAEAPNFGNCPTGMECANDFGTTATVDITSYDYTAAGRLKSITYPSGAQVTYTRDSNGRIQSVSITPPGGTATTVASNVTYQPFGPISGYTLGNGQAITRTYDANYRLTDLVSPAFTLHVARDAMGDITAIGNSAGANPATETYSYDPLYRLTQITEADGSTLESVTYNPTGDRLSKTGSGLATGAYSYNPNTHQLVATGNAARTVDADGNTTAISQAGSTYGFGYNARNRMTLAQLNQSTVANYTYNAEGERVAKTANGTTERYNYGPSSQLLSEYGATNREYVYLDGIPVANLDTQGTTSSIAYVTADELGTPRAIADSSGNTEWSWAYQGNAWGEQSPTSNGYTYNPRFQGQYADAETGLNYNVNRDYDPNLGRYIESDTLGMFGGQSSTYAYVDDNPLDLFDPLGFGACTVLYPDYPIDTGFGFRSSHLGGHGAILSFDSSGETQYYEYGRYSPADPGVIGAKLSQEDGNVRRGPVPDVDVDPKTELPTQKSMDALSKYLSKRYGEGSKAMLVCSAEPDAKKVNKYAQDYAKDKNRPKYSWKPWSSNQCRDFSNRAFGAGQ